MISVPFKDAVIVVVSFDFECEKLKILNSKLLFSLKINIFLNDNLP